jgi:hypothetical protein
MAIFNGARTSVRFHGKPNEDLTFKALTQTHSR